MKSPILGFLLTIAVFSTLYAQKNEVKIDGKLANKASYTVIYLDTLTPTGSEQIAQAEIDPKGKFSLKAEIERTNFFKIRLADTNYIILILSPGEHLNFQAVSPRLGVDAQVTGSSQTEVLYRNIRQVQFYDRKRDSLNKVYNQVMGGPESEVMGPRVVREFTLNDSLQKAQLKSEYEKMPNSLAWIFFQDKFDMTADFPFIDKMEKSLYANYPYIPYIQQFHQQIEVERLTAVGAVAPDISLPDPEGNMRNLYSLKGKVVLLDFWASWCGPCRKENPNVVNAYNKYHDKGFEVFSVSLDKDRDSWLKAIAKDGLIWPNHVSDLKYWKSAGAAAYGVSAIPCTFLIDRDGKIIGKKLRGEALEQKLEELLH